MDAGRIGCLAGGSNMTGVTIAEAEAADLPVILRLRHEAFQSEAEIYRMAIPPLRQPHDIMVILLEPPPRSG